MVFFKYGESNTQHGSISSIYPTADQFCKKLPIYTFREFCVHEQYFYPHYQSYYADYYDRFETSIRWAVENGYEPTFVSDLIEFDRL